MINLVVDPSIVFVGSSTNHTAPQGEAVEMPEEEVDRLNDWTQNLAFTARTTGFYFFNLNAGFMPGKQGTLALQGILNSTTSFCTKLFSFDKKS